MRFFAVHLVIEKPGRTREVIAVERLEQNEHSMLPGAVEHFPQFVIIEHCDNQQDPAGTRLASLEYLNGCNEEIFAHNRCARHRRDNLRKVFERTGETARFCQY